MQDLRLWKVANNLTFKELSQIFKVTPQHIQSMSSNGCKVTEVVEGNKRYIGLILKKYYKEIEKT